MVSFYRLESFGNLRFTNQPVMPGVHVPEDEGEPPTSKKDYSISRLSMAGAEANQAFQWNEESSSLKVREFGVSQIL